MIHVVMIGRLFPDESGSGESDLAEIDLDGEGCGQLYDAGEEFAVAVAPGRRVENVVASLLQ